VDGTIKTRADLDQLWWPDLGDVERRLSDLVEQAEGTGFGIIYRGQTAGATTSAAIGIEDFCIASIEDPAFVDEVENRIHEYCLKELEMALSYPIDMVGLGSGLTMNSGPMLCPEMMERFEFSQLREMAAVAKKNDLPVFLHIDGRIIDFIDDLVAMGADLLHPVETCSGAQDIYEIKRRFGDRVTLCGNIDINGVLVHGSPDEVRQDVLEHIDRLSGGGGYVVSSSHNLHELISAENYFAMRDAVHGYRRGG
jgi:uroporphyrinogen decarboxylase